MFQYKVNELKSRYLMDFFSRYPDYVKEMKVCNHSADSTNMNPFHLEDDVWAHTLLVLQAMELDYTETDSLVNHARVISALCHDIGKIYTRTVKNFPRVSFFGHEYASVQPTTDFIYAISSDWTDEQKERMVNIVLPAVSHHLEAYRNIRVNEFADWCNYNYDTLLVLTSLMVADHNGRFFDHDHETASGETETPKLALDIGTDIIVNSTNEYTLDDCRFILFGGVSGCGKDYMAATMFPDAEILSYDKIRVEYYCKNNTSKFHMTATELYNTAWKWANDNKVNFSQIINEKIRALPNGKRVVICNNHITRKGRRRTISPLRSAFKNEKVGMVYVTAPSDIIYSRNESRVDDKIVKRDMITHFIQNQCIPSMYEGLSCVKIVCNY